MLALLAVQVPVEGRACEGGPVAPVAAQAQAPSGKTTGPQTGTSPRGSSSNRQPNGPPRQNPTSGSGSSMIDDIDQRWPWWNDAQIKQQLGLSEATVQAIDNIVRERFRMARDRAQEFDRERAKLDRMGPSMDENAFELQVRRVESLRTELTISRTMMNFRIAKQLQPEQLKKLREIAERRRASRDRSPGQGSNR